MIRAGKMRQTVSIERFVVTSRGDRGQPVGTWESVYARVPVEIVPLRGRQLEIARQLVASATHEVRLRHHSGIVPAMRLTYRGRHFAIGYVDETDFRGHELRLLTTEQVTGATP